MRPPAPSFVAPRPTLAPSLVALSCPNVRVCYVGAQQPAPILATRDAGATWYQQVNEGGERSCLAIDCPAPRVCFAPLYAPCGDLAHPPLPLLTTDDGGQTWGREVPPRAGTRIGGCYVVSHDTIGRSADGGRAWDTAAFRPGSCDPEFYWVRFDAIACPGERICRTGCPAKRALEALDGRLAA